MVVEGVAGGQHQPTQPLRMAGGHHLGDRAATVVADQDDLVQVQGLQEVGDQPAKPGGGQVGSGAHRGRVGAEGQLGSDAAELAVEQLDDGIPQVGAMR
jgi:hypothetical protein